VRGGCASADEVAALIQFLVSLNGGYLKGAALDVDGGLRTHVF
jgi:hypothetical protein